VPCTDGRKEGKEICGEQAGAGGCFLSETNKEREPLEETCVLAAEERTALNCPTNAANEAKSTGRQTTRPQINRQQISDAISCRPSLRFSTLASQLAQHGRTRLSDGRTS
jgi:hypothetical protein